ncbi:MAG: class I SAM-dependent methyltransferase [Flavisolibacter sp.]
MQQLFDKYLMFRNRLEKVYRHLGRQARKQGIGCFRVYDHDLPEFPFIIEKFEGRVYVSEYRRRHGLTEEEHEAWMEECRNIMSEVLDVKPEDIYVKLRQRKQGRQGQYQKLAEERNEFVVNENGLKFLVNLQDYLDTGLFLDHRLTREMVRAQSEGKNVLNLFCYTGSFSVYAAADGAKKVVSVDLSKTYISWAERNMKLNFPDRKHDEFIQADVLSWIKTAPADAFDIVVLDPPTFSNSKRMEGILDVQRDHVTLINDCLRCLKPGGSLYFSTNFTSFRLDSESLRAADIRDITAATTPFDFHGKLRRYCFLLKK